MKHKVRQIIKHSFPGETGQSLLLIALAFVALLLVIGLAIDLGLLYVERIKIGKACDAAALAAAPELPFEDFAVRRAMQYMEENGYGPDRIHLVVKPMPTGSPNYVEAWNDQNGDKVVGTITIDVESYRACDPSPENCVTRKPNTADKIMVHGKIFVNMNFMIFAGFETAPVEAQALAENVSSIDVVVVLDQSGSMGYDTYCYECYREVPGKDYPDGYREYLPYADWICGAQQVLLDYQNYEMLAAEAEYFSYSTSIGAGPNDYRRARYKAPNTFWMLQRTKNSQASGYACYDASRQMCGAHLMHMPHLEDINGHSTVTDSAPRLDYVFDIPNPSTFVHGSTNKWYVWIRAQCGYYKPSGSRVGSCVVHWGVDGHWNPSNYPSTSSSDFDSVRGGGYTGSNGNRWTWVRLGNVTFANSGQHAINIWGGGSGFRLDKIVISRNSQDPSGSADKAPAFIQNATPTWNSVRHTPYQTYVDDSRYGGPPDTRGRTGYACHKCNPIYGQKVNVDLNGNGRLDPFETEDLNNNGRIDVDEICDNSQDDIYDDKQPIRAAQEAGKSFIKRLNAHFDQVGFVSYSTHYNPNIIRELNCVKIATDTGLQLPDDKGVWNPETNEPDAAWVWCYDHRTSSDGYSGSTRSTSLINGSVIGAIEDMTANGSTNIAEGLQVALDTLGTGTGHYGRPASAKVIILLTDGEANQYPAGPCDDDPDLWSGGAAKDCVIYYAQQARNRGVVIYSIGLGVGADHDLLQAVADRTGGLYYFAPSGEQLDAIFQEIADQIFLRLIE